MLAILGCCCQAESSSCHWGMGGHHQPTAPRPAPTPGRAARASLQAPRRRLPLFADRGPILCSQPVHSKDKPQENSCCLLTLTIRIVGTWRKQEMTNVFSDLEEVMAESGCLVTDTLKDDHRGAQPSTAFPRTLGGCHGTRDCCIGDTEGAVAGGPSGSLGVLPHVVPGRKEVSQRMWAQAPPSIRPRGHPQRGLSQNGDPGSPGTAFLGFMLRTMKLWGSLEV